VGVPYTATLSPEVGFTLPENIKITVGGTELTSRYSYDNSTGKLSIDAEVITGDITITAEGVRKTYDVVNTLTNLTSNGAASCQYGIKYTATLTPASSYSRPAEIIVKVGDTVLTVGYSYSSSTGVVAIDADKVTGNIEIIAAATEDYYTLVGPESLMGSNWDTTDPNNRMFQTGDGIFTYIFDELAGYRVLGIHGECKNMETAIKDFTSVYKTPIDILIGGHKHHKEADNVGIRVDTVSVPSIIGVDDYSISLNKTADAGATMLFVEAGKGISIEYNIKFDV
jgi:hypothetical protein